MIQEQNQAAMLYLRRPFGPTGFGECMRDFVVADHTPSKQHPQGRRLVADRWFSLCWPPYPNTGRNLLTARFLDTTPRSVNLCGWLDDDMEFEPWQLPELAALVHPVERPIVSALYFAHNGEERGKARPLVITDTGTQWDYPRDQLVRVRRVGMGCCFIAREWLEDWRREHGDTWFDYIGHGKADGFQLEDSAFCDRMTQFGASIWVHTGIIVGHLKLKRIGRFDHESRTALEKAVSANDAAERTSTPIAIP